MKLKTPTMKAQATGIGGLSSVRSTDAEDWTCSASNEWTGILLYTAHSRYSTGKNQDMRSLSSAASIGRNPTSSN
jgi:hypothetical protein